MSRGNILSIQSHVAYGHVGNAAATLPLQGLGFAVWPVHTCLFSNHTGYPALNGHPTRGMVFEPEVIADVLDGLRQRGVLAACDGVLSGWLGKAAIGDAVRDAAATARQQRAGQGFVYLCDPVLGDDSPSGLASEGRLYAAPDIPAYFRQQLIPCADVLTPNRFELEMLSGQPVRTLAQAQAAARTMVAQMHPAGARICLVTSLPDDRAPETISCLVVTPEQSWMVTTPRLSFAPLAAPNGAGDCLAALFLGFLLREGHPAQALGSAVSSLYGILETTLLHGAGPGGRSELALVESLSLIQGTPQKFKAISLSLI